MKFLIPSIAKYWHLAPAYMSIFNKYYSDYEAVYLCYDEVPDIPMPPNFSKVYIGCTSDRKDWASTLMPYIQCMDDYYICILPEDGIINRPPDDISKIDLLLAELNRRASKALLDRHMNLPQYVEDYKPELFKLKQSSAFRTSLHPAIWRKDYLLKYMKPGMSVWSFERQHQQSMHDGALIVALKNYTLFGTADLYRRGRLVGKSLRQLSSEDYATVMQCNPSTR